MSIQRYCGGVAITLDDNDINGWYNAHKALEKYGWRATFFVSHFDSLGPEQIEKLKTLHDYGHEIGGHTITHPRAQDYVNKYGIDAYLENEIYPMKELMEKEGFYPTSFAYPYGDRNDIIDEHLLKHFNILRATRIPRKKEAGFFNKIIGRIKSRLNRQKRNKFYICDYFDNKLLYSDKLDENNRKFSSVKRLIDLARMQDKVICFYAHKTVDKDVAFDNLTVEISRLVEMCEYMVKNNMKFVTISELALPAPKEEL